MSDAGIRAVDFVYQQMAIDDEWAIKGEREFTWWGRNLAQIVRAEKPVLDRNLYVSRLTAVTPLVRAVKANPVDVCKRLTVFNGMAALLSGFVFDPQKSEVSLACSMKVYDNPDDDEPDTYSEAVTRLFFSAVAAQAAQAHVLSEALAEMLSGTVATSRHPTSGIRIVPDNMLEALTWFRKRSADRSVWARGNHMKSALAIFRKAGLLATGDDTGVSAEIPFYGTTALFVLDANEQHPTVGKGLSARLSLPGRTEMEIGATTAAMLNQAETNPKERPFASYTGGWCFGPNKFVTFASFYPNIAPVDGFAAAIAQEAMLRVRWLTRSMFQDPRHPSKRGRARTSLEDILGIGG